MRPTFRTTSDFLRANDPLRVMFCITSMPVGGAETLLVNLIRRMDRDRFAPELCCLKELGPLGEVLAAEIPTHQKFTTGKFDIRVLGRLTKLFRSRRIDAVVTVGAGDKMFWGRLAAWRAGVPVVCSAIHSTGWPDGINFLNRGLTRITDAFIGVAKSHGEHLTRVEGFPGSKVQIIPNGVDVQRFRPREEQKELRAALGIPLTAPVTGIVAALRSEKNHELLLRATQLVLQAQPDTHLVIIGDGPERLRLEALTEELGIGGAVRFLGTRHDIPELVSMLDIFVLTSHMEANPVSILEAMASGKPVVAPRVGSIPDTVQDGQTGFLFVPGDVAAVARAILKLIESPALAQQFGMAGRSRVVANWSLEVMVRGYEDLIVSIYAAKTGCVPMPRTASVQHPQPALVDLMSATADSRRELVDAGV